MTEMKDSKLTSRKSGGGERDSNLELFRIITMLLIVAHHYVVNSGLISEGGPIYSSPLSIKSWVFLMFGAWGKPGINCFLLITGYYMCCSRISLKKFCKLLFQILFYNTVIACIFWLSGYSAINLKAIAKTILPVNSLSRNFTGCFLVFYLCIPFINALIQHISEKQHQLLIMLFIFMYVILGSNLLGKVEMNYVSWFAVVYLIAAYIRIYPKPVFEKRRLWGLISLGLAVVTGISFIGIAYASIRLMGEMKGLYFLVTDSNYIVPLTFGISTFLYFKNTKVRYNRLINLLGASTFGVFCIHTNGDAMRKWLWGDLLKVVQSFGKGMPELHLIGSVLFVFICCTAIDIARKKVIEEPFFKKCWPLIEHCWKKKTSQLKD